MTIIYLVILWLIALNRGLIPANQTKSIEISRKDDVFETIHCRTLQSILRI